MSWVKWALMVLGLSVLVSSISKPAQARIRSAGKLPERAELPKDRVRTALASGDLEEMIAVAANEKIAPLDTHALLLAITEKTYPRREEPLMKDKFFMHARSYVENFPRMLPALKSQSPDAVATTPVFKMLAIALTNDGQYDEAIAVCRKAIELGVEDGTKTGFEGRIQRIQKLQNDN